MLSLLPERLDRMLLLGAHCDDIAIGAGGSLLELCRAHPGVSVSALVLTGGGSLREEEERAALAAFCPGARLEIAVLDMVDGHVPTRWERAKLALEELRAHGEPDLIFAPSPHDAHQDHRIAGRAGAHRVPRPPHPRLRDPQVGERPGPAHGLPAAGRAGAAGEGDQAARALRQPGRPQLVRRRDVQRAGPDPRGAVPGPVRRGLPRVQAGARGRPAGRRRRPEAA